jgi:hypothetical protein
VRSPRPDLQPAWSDRDRDPVIFPLGGIVIATFYPFASVILNDRGFDPAQIGLVMAGGSVAFALSVPVWGHLADVRLGRAGALRIAVFLSGLALVSFGLPWPAVVLAAMFLAFAGTESAIAPLSDAIAVNALPHPERITDPAADGSRSRSPRSPAGSSRPDRLLAVIPAIRDHGPRRRWGRLRPIGRGDLHR